MGVFLKLGVAVSGLSVNHFSPICFLEYHTLSLKELQLSEEICLNPKVVFQWEERFSGFDCSQYCVITRLKKKKYNINRSMGVACNCLEMVFSFKRKKNCSPLWFLKYDNRRNKREQK